MLSCEQQGAAGAITSEAKRRHAFLQQLRNRLATPSTGEGETEVETVGEPELNLKLLVAKHGVEDWMQVRGDWVGASWYAMCHVTMKPGDRHI